MPGAAAVQTDVPFDRNVKGGRDTVGLEVPKSNWANTLDKPAFETYAVTCRSPSPSAASGSTPPRGC